MTTAAHEKQEQAPHPACFRSTVYSCPPPGPWVMQAACRDIHGRHAALFDPLEGRTGKPVQHSRIAEAKQFCAVCPVRAECLRYGQVNDLLGVWGGHYLGVHKRGDAE